MIQPEKRNVNLLRRLIAKFRAQTVLTMIYLAGFVDTRDYEITFVNEYSKKIPYGKHFDLVAITVNTPNAPHCYEISAHFRKSGAKVVMGGPHVTLLPDEAIEHCDHLILQEADITWPQFLEDFKNGSAKSLYHPYPPAELCNLPKPRWDLLGRTMIKGAVFSTRGCPYNCSFCTLRLVYDPAFRKRPIQDVIEDIKVFPIKFFVFWDDNLFADKEYIKELLRAMIPLKRKWGALATLRDCNDEELMALAKKSGCQYLFVGIESFSEEALKEARKGGVNRISEYETIISLIHRYKIMVYAGIVFGFDSDTADIFEKTYQECEKLGIDFATPGILTPYPKTSTYEKLEAEGRIFTKDWSRYDGKSVVYEPKNMTAEELVQGNNYFLKRFFSLRSIIKRARISRAKFYAYFKINIGYLFVQYKNKKVKKNDKNIGAPPERV